MSICCSLRPFCAFKISSQILNNPLATETRILGMQYVDIRCGVVEVSIYGTSTNRHRWLASLWDKRTGAHISLLSPVGSTWFIVFCRDLEGTRDIAALNSLVCSFNCSRFLGTHFGVSNHTGLVYLFSPVLHLNVNLGQIALNDAIHFILILRHPS